MARLKTPEVLRVGVLGPLDVRRGEQTLPVKGRRERAVVAALALHAGTTVALDALIEMLWGEDAPATAAKTLQGYVSRARRALRVGTEVLERREKGYALVLDRAQVDALAFEDAVAAAREAIGEADPARAVTLLRDALALWRADAPADLGETPAAVSAARVLTEQRMDATEDLFDAELAAGRDAELVPDLERVVGEHPTRERVWAQLLLALYRAGKQAEALATFERARAVLAGSVGIEPSPELRELHERVLAHDASLAVRPAPGAPTNLPEEVSSLVDREAEVRAIVAALRPGGVLTLAGPAGVGKSRVAARVAREALERHPDGVWWCEPGAAAPMDALAGIVPSMDDLPRARCLIVLDGGAAPDAVADLARRCERASIVVTARDALGIDDERVVSIEPLPIGIGGPSPAVDLFAERARAAAGEDLGDERTLTQICSSLDGIPLAIELIAARARSMSPPEILDRLDERAVATGTGDRVRDAVEWALDVMTELEEAVFLHAAVFEGPFTAEAAGRVAGLEAGPVLASLAERALVTRQPSSAGARYRMLGPVRATALAHLEAGEQAARGAHASAMLDVAEREGEAVTARGEAEAVRAIRAWRDDLRAAHAWALEHDEDVALRLPYALRWYAFGRQDHEVLAWARAAAGRASDHPLRAEVAGLAVLGLPAPDGAGDAVMGAFARAVAGLRSGDTAPAHEAIERAARRDPFAARWLRGTIADEPRALEAFERDARATATPSLLALAALARARATEPADALEHLRAALRHAGDADNRVLLPRASAAVRAAALRSDEPGPALRAMRDLIELWHGRRARTELRAALADLSAVLERNGRSPLGAADDEGDDPGDVVERARAAIADALGGA